MDCLYCGDCCIRMSPLSTHSDYCPNLIIKGTFRFCSDYKNRPHEYANHEFHSRFCPIGMDVLKLDNLDSIRRRIDKGWELIKGGLKDD